MLREVCEVTERDLSISMGHELHAHAGGDRMIRAKSQAEVTRRACDCSALSPYRPPQWHGFCPVTRADKTVNQTGHSPSARGV